MVIFLVALSLSMDAFSLALIYGINDIEKRYEILLSIIVGLFHLCMPLLGYTIGEVILNIFPIELHILVSIIFAFIGIEMIVESFKEKKYSIVTNITGIFLFGLAVSIDSFGVGITFNILTNHIFLSSIIFMIISGFMTYIGLIFGKIVGKKIGNVANLLGGLILIILGILYLFK